jgi:hypothetical protein
MKNGKKLVTDRDIWGHEEKPMEEKRGIQRII